MHGAFYRLTEAVFRHYLSPILATFMIAVMLVQNHDLFSFVMLVPSHLKQVVAWISIVAMVRIVGAQASRHHVTGRVESLVEDKNACALVNQKA